MICYNKIILCKQTNIVTHKAFNSLMKTRMQRQSIKMRYAWVVSGEKTADPDGLGPLNVEEGLPVKFADRYVSDIS